MSAEVHPQVAEAMKQMHQLQAMLEDQMKALNTGSFTGTDLEKTVEVTLNGSNMLTDLYIQDGLLRLGSEAVALRVNEALRGAQAAATASLVSKQEELMAGLTGITDSLVKGMDLK